MPPRTMKKEKRGPELWYRNPKTRNMDDSQKEDDAFIGTATRSRSKFLPGPDLATAVTEEFQSLPRPKSTQKSEAHDVQAAAASQQPVSENRSKIAWVL